MRLLALDYGHRKIGVAISDERGDFAYPHSVIANSAKALDQLADLCRQEKVGKIVIGESLNLTGQANSLMSAITTAAAKLAVLTGLPVDFEREFYTTQEANRLIGPDQASDARAAALILKSYLARHHHGEQEA